jgi:hypothetical protein
MNPIKPYVCSFSTAKKLKKLGVKKESLFVYSGNEENEKEAELNFVHPFWGADVKNCWAAYTLQELVELIDALLGSGNWKYIKRKNSYSFSVFKGCAIQTSRLYSDKSIPEVFASFLRYLLEWGDY